MKKVDPAVQRGIGLAETGNILSAWIETGQACPFACEYCYARGGGNSSDCMAWPQYESILEQFAAQGGETIGIPGAGEPFHPENRGLIMNILRKCAELGIYVTLFTTGVYIDRELAEKLYQLPVELMIKGNSLDPDVQDRFVSNPSCGKNIHGYGKIRNQALDLLMEVGFNKPGYGRQSRMAIVSSIMEGKKAGEPSNYEEIPSLLRWAREHDVIFDVDSVLQIGRGEGCHLCTEDQRLRTMIEKLQAIDAEEFNRHWTPGPGYVGGKACDRFRHHLYIDRLGTIRPCIGAIGVNLGNIAEGTTLIEAWNHPVMQRIRGHQVKGACSSCQNFVQDEQGEAKCYSCLGRYSCNSDGSLLSNEGILQDGVHTYRCVFYLEKDGGDG